MKLGYVRIGYKFFPLNFFIGLGPGLVYIKSVEVKKTRFLESFLCKFEREWGR